MGPVILGTILHEKGYDVGIYNENLSGSLLENPEALKDVAQADYVGISIMTPTASRGYQLADHLKKLNAGIKIMLGGVHATFCTAEAIQHADYVVRGEGEYVIEDIVSGRLAPGIIQGTPVRDLDALPLPKYELIRDYEKLWEQDGGKALYRAPLVTSRGCPYNCKYCSVTAMFGHQYRFQSARRVIHDMNALHGEGYRGFFFYDDNFVADRGRLDLILGELARLDVAWNAQARLDFAWEDPRQRRRPDSKLLDLMKKSGGDILYVGYETIEDETAREWRKGYRGHGSLRSRSAADTRLLHSAGFWIHGMFVAGPQHNESTLHNIVNFARHNHIETIQISALTPFPGTALFDAFKQKLVFTRFPSDWDVYDGLHAVYQDTKMGICRFQKKLIDAHRQFYRGSWMYLDRIGKLFRGPGSFARKAYHLGKWARMPRDIFGNWDRETKQFLREVATRNGRALLPG